ncbi:hypothetical protein ECTW14301_1825, partial [Escherichia coli TW14301]
MWPDRGPQLLRKIPERGGIMTFKHYDVVRAASPSDLAEKLTHKLK